MFSIGQATSLPRRIYRDRRGVTALEYALLAGAIAVAVVAAAGTFSGDLQGAYSQLGSRLTSSTPAS